MLEYKRIDISEGIDVNKTNLSKECDICHYWYYRINFWYMSKDDAINVMNGSILLDKRGVL